MPISNCCSAPFIIGYKEDGERCSACKEHCGIDHECERTDPNVHIIYPLPKDFMTIHKKLDKTLPDV